LQELDPEEEKAFELFMKKGQQHHSLAETIQSRLTEKRTEIETVMSGRFILCWRVSLAHLASLEVGVLD